MSGDWSSMRAGDEARDRVNSVLSEAYAEGRLRPAEFERRLDRVLKAKTYEDLQEVVTDLPGGLAAVPPNWADRPSHPASPQRAPGTPGAPHPPQAAAGRNQRATHALVAGLFGIVTLGVTAVIAVIFGHRAIREINRSGEAGYGSAVTGLVLGYFWAAIWALFWMSVLNGL